MASSRPITKRGEMFAMLKAKGIPTGTTAAVIRTCGELTPHTVGVLLYCKAQGKLSIPWIVGSIRGKTACRADCEGYIEQAAEMLREAERRADGDLLEDLL